MLTYPSQVENQWSHTHTYIYIYINQPNLHGLSWVRSLNCAYVFMFYKKN